MQRKAPLPGKIFARCIPKQLLAGLFGCMARISCQSQLISDAWRANLVTNWRFSRPRPLSECMERKTCHGLPPENAPRRNLATDRRSGTHRARILPLSVARERIREDLAMDERLDSPRTKQLPLSPQKNGAEGRTWRTSPHQKHERQSSGAAGTSNGGTARCSAIAEHSGTHRGGISPWPTTRPETKEGEHFARLLLLFCLRLEWPSGPSR